MLTLLIGHRGAGKTALLERIRGYGADLRPRPQAFDLDAEIEKGERTTVNKIFAARGEESFRSLERRYLAQLVVQAQDMRTDTYLSVGAGFEGPIPPGARCLWVRRPSDATGRIFVDRPRLDRDLDPLDEYRRRFRKRDERFRDWADEVITIPEGFDRASPRERDLLLGEVTKVGGELTLLPENFRSAAYWKTFAKNHLRLGVAHFELRDDLLGVAALEAALTTLPASRVLYSFRRARTPWVPPKLGDLLWDWPLELGVCPHGEAPLASLHARGEGEAVAAAAARLDAAAGPRALRKLAVETRSFDELLEGHRWMQEDPRRRAFLPHSKDGRWSWYRAHFRGALAFFRESEGSAPDQPYLLDWLRARPQSRFFSAVLGDPIAHSRTPAEQESFFLARAIPVYSIRVTREEWEAGALEALRELGLRFAAVTSPLKAHAAKACGSSRPSINTLRFSEETGWLGESTDEAGLAALFAATPPVGEVAVWGGGALLSMLEEALPKAHYYAARTGEPRDGTTKECSPDTVVWAGSAPRVGPPVSWKPKLVIDLGYREDSPARRYALRTGARFVDGTAMFAAQAAAQRKFWV